MGILRDVSERKLAQEALRQSEQRYRRIVETAQEGVWVHDLEGRTSFVNARMAEMLGYTVADLQGRKILDFVDPHLQATFQVYLERRRHGIGETHDFQFRCKDGSTLWAIVSASPLNDDEGRVIGVLKMITDITERRWAEQELSASERRFRDIARNIPGVVFQFRVRSDGTHYFSYLSPRAQEILNLEVPIDSPEWVLGSGVHPDDREKFVSSVIGGDLDTERLAVSKGASSEKIASSNGFWRRQALTSRKRRSSSTASYSMSVSGSVSRKRSGR